MAKFLRVNEELTKNFIPFEHLENRDLGGLIGSPTSTEQSDPDFNSLSPFSPRFYSIGDIEPNEDGLALNFQLTVGHGEGVAAQYVQHLQKGDMVTLRPFPSPKFRQPEDKKTPLLLVGQGSALGPLVGFLKARARSNVKRRCGEILFIAAARKREGLPYLDEMLALSRKLPLTIKLALTQDDARVVREGVETQVFGKRQRAPDVIRQEHTTIKRLLAEGGHVFVCGSTDFGISVRKALGKASKGGAISLGRTVTPPPPSDWRSYHEDLFGSSHTIPPRTIDRFELSMHNSFDDFWTAIDGVVYDLTKYAGLHPGGSKVLMESAGTTADDRFYRTHGGPYMQEVKGQMCAYAIGTLKPDDSSPAVQQLLEATVRAQNTLSNNTAFPADRDVPFYAYADSLIVFAENGINEIRSAFKAATTTSLDETQAMLRDASLELRAAARKALASTTFKTLKGQEEAVRQAYIAQMQATHNFLDKLKLSLRNDEFAPSGFVADLRELAYHCRTVSPRDMSPN